ncbi:hypothetical protein V492_02895 [Pseudogymnoascus sp. VKM F-4246]|nr:hypothetical protein V492_02895 [Pseudogymnoascus sp. VKM F-4246]
MAAHKPTEPHYAPPSRHPRHTAHRTMCPLAAYEQANQAPGAVSARTAVWEVVQRERHFEGSAAGAVWNTRNGV